MSNTAGSCCACKGSNFIYGKAGNMVKISVPVHGNQALKTGLLRFMMKQASISEDDL